MQGRSKIPTAVVVGILVVGAPCVWIVWQVFRYREARIRYHDQQLALFAAEAGVEATKIYLESVCTDPLRKAELLESAARQEVPMPGQEGSLREFFGYTLPGGGSVIVRLRATSGGTSAPGIVVRSTGQAGAEQHVLVRDLACPASR